MGIFDNLDVSNRLNFELKQEGNEVQRPDQHLQRPLAAMAVTPTTVRMGSLLWSNSHRMSKSLPAFHIIRSYSKLKPPKENSKFFQGRGPAILVGSFVIIAHFIWRGFQDTDLLDGKGAKFPHGQYPAMLGGLFRKIKTNILGSGEDPRE